MTFLLCLVLMLFLYVGGNGESETKLSRKKRSDVELLCNSINVDARRVNGSGLNVTIWYDRDVDKVNSGYFPVRFSISLVNPTTSESSARLRTLYLTKRKGLLSHVYPKKINRTTSYYLNIKPKCGNGRYDSPDPCEPTCTTIQIALFVRKETPTTTNLKTSTPLQIDPKIEEIANGTILENKSEDKGLFILPLVITVAVLVVGLFVMFVCIFTIYRRCNSTRADNSQTGHTTEEDIPLEDRNTNVPLVSHEDNHNTSNYLNT